VTGAGGNAVPRRRRFPGGSRLWAAAVVLGLLVLTGGVAQALINPNFTPVQLVEKADLILVLNIRPPAEGSSRCSAEVVRCIKGRTPANRQVFDLNSAANREHGLAIRRMLAEAGAQPALLFVGKGDRDEPLALLHVGGKWVALNRAPASPPAR